MQLEMLAQNLASPPLLFFVLGIIATRIRSDLMIPDQVGKFLSLYLVLAIGFKGGVQLRTDGITADVALAVVVAVLLSALLPLLAYAILRWATPVTPVDAAALAAHYGSVSVVTFLAAKAFLDLLGVGAEAYMVTLLAVMEAPGVVVGIVLARRVLAAVPGRPTEASRGYGGILRESFTNGSLLLLLGALVIGWTSGPVGLSQVAGFVEAPFTGVLMVFLLDMGIVAARRLDDVRALGWSVALFGVAMAVIGGAIGVLAGAAIGLSVGGTTLLGVLSGSASYIAAPATIRMAVPEANPSLYLTLPLGITFPFNLVAGIPLYYVLAQVVTGA